MMSDSHSSISASMITTEIDQTINQIDAEKEKIEIMNAPEGSNSTEKPDQVASPILLNAKKSPDSIPYLAPTDQSGKRQDVYEDLTTTTTTFISPERTMTAYFEAYRNSYCFDPICWELANKSTIPWFIDDMRITTLPDIYDKSYCLPVSGCRYPSVLKSSLQKPSMVPTEFIPNGHQSNYFADGSILVPDCKDRTKIATRSGIRYPESDPVCTRRLLRISNFFAHAINKLTYAFTSCISNLDIDATLDWLEKESSCPALGDDRNTVASRLPATGVSQKIRINNQPNIGCIQVETLKNKNKTELPVFHSK